MVSIQQLTVEYPSKTLFKDINFLINPGERIGLAGRNGAGKSTLLKIIAGEISPHQGLVAKPRDISIGYLPQILPLPTGKTVKQEAETALDDIRKIQTEIDLINEALATRTDYDSQEYMHLIQRVSDLTHEFQVAGGYEAEGKVEKILKGLGFTDEDLDRQLDTFSGGWRMRVELAKILLKPHQLMLMDEPTNHLDLQSILWLENFLKNSDRALLLISHDKTFLDNVTTRTLEIAGGKIYDYPVPYSKFVELRKERIEHQQLQRKNQEKEIKETQQLIDRFRAKATKASFAQSLIKRLDKIELIEVDTEDTKTMHFRFPPAPLSGKVVLKAENVSMAFGEKTVLKQVNFEIERGERVAFVGKNGQGKTTMVRMILGELQGGGTLTIGHNVQIGYYAQEQHLTQDADRTLLEVIESAAPDELRPRARSLLGAFMFSGDEVYKKVKVLSGGERGRLALCKLLLQPSNLLVLDEPTNHLDIASKNVLKQALLDFEGTIVLVSHDRDFLQGLATKVFEFQGGTVKEWLGDIDSFLAEKQRETFRDYESKPSIFSDKKPSLETSSKTTEKQTFSNKNEQKKLQQKIEKIESEIHASEHLVKALEERLTNPEIFATSKGVELLNQYETTKKALEALMQQWEELTEALEKIQME
ncbi:ABC-F family ATP-binding cassette domain-containing protein [Thermaurantimonas aggregans]|uniref:ABC-F family ATP-binding cassette domain-containing protein n=1 Tax=Thermaurantimonas aggregans TaxID=2173829 RepID=UPI0023F017C1|nr:ABC-F family ATP-binding cassette domain-containing protein [Thermaurantimonas aggregans]MCX8149694.1 ABC-F family ATP-binding cassette domain-containing protein [Thermaurantimonas aggregans]